MTVVVRNVAEMDFVVRNGLTMGRRVESKPNAPWSVDFVHDQLACGRQMERAAGEAYGTPEAEYRRLIE